MISQTTSYQMPLTISEMSDPATYTTPLTGKQEALYNDAMRVMNANMSLPLL